MTTTNRKRAYNKIFGIINILGHIIRKNHDTQLTLNDKPETNIDISLTKYHSNSVY